MVLQEFAYLIILAMADGSPPPLTVAHPSVYGQQVCVAWAGAEYTRLPGKTAKGADTFKLDARNHEDNSAVLCPNGITFTWKFQPDKSAAQ